MRHSDSRTPAPAPQVNEYDPKLPRLVGVRRRSSLADSDAFQAHNRVPATLLTVVSGCFSLCGIGCCLAWGRMHWAGLVAVNVAILLAIVSLVMYRSRAGWGVLVAGLLALVVCLFMGRIGEGLLGPDASRNDRSLRRLHQTAASAGNSGTLAVRPA